MVGPGESVASNPAPLTTVSASSWIALTVKEPIVDAEMRTMNWAHCVPGYLHPSGTMKTPRYARSGSRRHSSRRTQLKLNGQAKTLTSYLTMS